MLATVKAALNEAEGAAAGGKAGVDRIAAAASFGALMGARGNSGVITSQILRGFAEALAGKTRFNGLDLANALESGTKAAYGAVAKPVEGTILTVIREASAASVAIAERENDLEAVLTRDPRRGREVGREDALAPADPARGRRRRFRRPGPATASSRAPSSSSSGARPRPPGRPPCRPPAEAVASSSPTRDEGFGYETMYLLQARAGRAPRRRRRSAATSRGWASRCSWPAMRGPSRSMSTTSGPDLVIAYGLETGSLSRISVENLDNQARDVRETRAAEFTAGARDEGPGGHGAEPAGRVHVAPCPWTTRRRSSPTA